MFYAVTEKYPLECVFDFVSPHANFCDEFVAFYVNMSKYCVNFVFKDNVNFINSYFQSLQINKKLNKCKI